MDPLDALKKAKVILLIDWPNPELPGTLLGAGFNIFCYSPTRYTSAEIVAEYPHDVRQKKVFPPTDKGKGYLVFRPLDGSPATVDIANVYRPEDEHTKIITNILPAVRAKCIWLQPPLTSAKTRELATTHNLTFIEGHDIAELARRI